MVKHEYFGNFDLRGKLTAWIFVNMYIETTDFRSGITRDAVFTTRLPESKVILRNMFVIQEMKRKHLKAIKNVKYTLFTLDTIKVQSDV